MVSCWVGMPNVHLKPPSLLGGIQTDHYLVGYRLYDTCAYVRKKSLFDRGLPADASTSRVGSSRGSSHTNYAPLYPTSPPKAFTRERTTIPGTWCITGALPLTGTYRRGTAEQGPSFESPGQGHSCDLRSYCGKKMETPGSFC